jgi:hypothetical protein
MHWNNARKIIGELVRFGLKWFTELISTKNDGIFWRIVLVRC